MKSRRSPTRQGALEWIEQATHLLRTSPLRVLAAYYIGALPFVLGVLFFWADMSRSPFAKDHVVEAALGVALLFLWMKTWQAIFCLRLQSLVSGEPMAPLDFRRCLRIAAAQTAIQPAGLLLIPIALIMTLPFAWVYGFYQNATAIAEPGPGEGQSILARAARGTRFRTGQYHVILLVVSVFALLVFLNWTIVCVALPGLLKSLLGIETAFSRSTSAMLNSTFLATMAGLTYLSVDPILKALHVLRCFRGEAQTTGADLKAELHHLKATPQLALVVCLALLNFNALAEDAASTAPPQTSPVAQPSALPSKELDQTIEKVINQQKYLWRMPREKVAKPETGDGPIRKFFSKIGDMIKSGLKATVEWLGKLLEKLFKNRPRGTPSTTPTNWGGLAAGARLLLYALIAIAVLGLGYLIYRLIKSRRQPDEVIEAAPIQVVPDIRDENVTAEQLPEDEWTRLGRELLAKGEFRLAMRAFYLSSLASLGQRQLITLAKFKSNREYERELSRRAHALGDLLSLFSTNVLAFDRVWYGQHEVNAEAVNQFAANVQRIRTTA
ncbi:MAG: hypothetical protein RLY20_3409 [Verrucomicrobiota bacterium]|jgi:hypothetical protein